MSPDLHIGQRLVVLRPIDATCRVHVSEILSKEHPVTVPPGEVLVVKFVAPQVGAPFVWFRPHRYEALERAWVDAETRGSGAYRGYAIMLERTAVDECCRALP